jgi:hypothetical protein
VVRGSNAWSNNRVVSPHGPTATRRQIHRPRISVASGRAHRTTVIDGASLTVQRDQRDIAPAGSVPSAFPRERRGEVLIGEACLSW